MEPICLPIRLHRARCGLTCFGLKGDRFAGDAAEFMGVNPQVVLGPRDQILHCNGGLVCHRYTFHCLVALLETQERANHTLGEVGGVTFNT